MISILKYLLDMIYPKKCPVCHEILEDPAEQICRKCLRKLVFVGKCYCLKCGKPMTDNTDFCRECAGRKRAFTQGRSILVYDDLMRESIIKYKYGRRVEYGDFYAKLMCKLAGKQILFWDPDLIVPVPMHDRKRRVRGFNQAEYLARRISKEMGIPFSDRAVKKVKATSSQKKLNAKERSRNLEKAFEVCEDIDGLKILVIDDVYTTGSTMEEIASVLSEKGAEKVYFLTICAGYN